MLHHRSLVPHLTSVICVARSGAPGFNTSFAYKAFEAHSDEINCTKSNKQFSSKIQKSTSIYFVPTHCQNHWNAHIIKYKLE